MTRPSSRADPPRWTRTEAICGDASSRRYSRIRLETGDPAILVEYPPAELHRLVGDLKVLLIVAAVGVAVPDILWVDPGHGCAILEDFGRHDAAAVLAATPEGTAREVAAQRLIDPLTRLAQLPLTAVPARNQPLDQARLRWELAGFELWFVRHHRGLSPPPGLDGEMDRLAATVAAHPGRVCHRDYHLNNLYLLADGRTGVIDVQDLLVGPDTYDAASLLEERDMPQLLDATARQGWLATWADATGAAPGWDRRWLEAALQRGLKVIGTFARLEATGRDRYRPWLEASVRRLVRWPHARAQMPVTTRLLLDSVG